MRALLLAGAALALPLPAVAEVSATDALDRIVTLPGPAERVVALNVTAMGQLMSLGIAPVGAFGPATGESVEDYLRRERGMVLPSGIERVTDADWNPNWEVVAALAPDLVIGWSAEEVAAGEAIAPVFAVNAGEQDGAEALEAYEEGLRALARLTGRDAQAENAIARAQARLAAYEALAPSRPAVLHIGTADAESFWVFSDQDLNCQLLDRIADCAAPATDGSTYDQWTTEALLQADPEVILLVGSYWGDGTDPDALLDALDDNPLWVELRAVQAGRVHVLPHDARATSIWGVGDYLDTVAPLVHPDTFPVPLTDEQVAAALARD